MLRQCTQLYEICLCNYTSMIFCHLNVQSLTKAASVLVVCIVPFFSIFMQVLQTTALLTSTYVMKKQTFSQPRVLKMTINNVCLFSQKNAGEV